MIAQQRRITLYILIGFALIAVITMLVRALPEPKIIENGQSPEVELKGFSQVLVDSNRSTLRDSVTDVAPPQHSLGKIRRRAIPTSTEVTTDEKDRVRLLKKVIDDERPFQWSNPLALPVADPEPPDLSIAPPVKVDPKRVAEPDVPRLSAGVQRPVKQSK